MKRPSLTVRLYKRGLALSVAAGLAAGTGAYTFLYAKGASYLGHDSAACANCHIMRQQYNGWLKASHRAVAECNDCHTPENVLGRYTTKAANGFWHSFAFTSGRFHEPIRIKQRNLRITEQRCRDCHSEIVGMMTGPHGAEDVGCVRCHATVGHS
jgi:cytochrome c nitrite reductase small subunit